MLAATMLKQGWNLFVASFGMLGEWALKIFSVAIHKASEKYLFKIPVCVEIKVWFVDMPNQIPEQNTLSFMQNVSASPL